MVELQESRRSFLKQFGILTAGISLASSEVLALAKDDVATLTILHTNDTHSRLDPFPANSGRLSGLGGIARRKALIDTIRSQTAQSLLVDAGDIFQGTPYFNFFKGEPEMKALQAMGYEAATMGNHDFDEGVENFAEQLNHVNFPFIVSNYDFDDTALAGRIHKNQIIKKGGLKIGLFGLGINPDGLIPAKLFGKVKHLDPLQLAKQQVSELKEKGVDFILCLSHLGYEYQGTRISDRIVAQEVGGIDLIVGGHTHTFLDTPAEILNPDKRVTLIAQAGHSGVRLGRLDFTFEVHGKRRKHWWSESVFVK